jgi:hypothetical protein
MPPRSVADLVASACRSAPLDGAAHAGEALGGAQLVVRVGLWLDAGGRVTRARYRATTCAALIAYAEAGCALAEAEGAAALGAERLRAAVRGVHPLQRDRADLVALAFARAAARCPPRLAQGGAP